MLEKIFKRSNEKNKDNCVVVSDRLAREFFDNVEYENDIEKIFKYDIDKIFKYDRSLPADLIYTICYIPTSDNRHFKFPSRIDKVFFDRKEALAEFTSTFEKIRNDYEYCEVITNGWQLHRSCEIDNSIIILAWNKKNEEKQNDNV